VIGLMLYGEDPKVEAKCEELFSRGVDSIDPELRHLVIGAVVKKSDSDEIVKELLDSYRSTHSADLRDDICAGLTSARKASHIEILLGSITDNETIRRQDVFRW